MSTDAITIQVNSEVAQAYLAAAPEERRKMDFLASLQLAEYLSAREPLDKVLDDMDREARDRGLTPEVLDSILHD
jgi:hypothetical protein